MKKRLRLESGESGKLELAYTPTVISSQEFYLPLTMNRIRTDLRPESRKCLYFMMALLLTCQSLHTDNFLKHLASASARLTWEKMTPSRVVVAAASQKVIDFSTKELKILASKLSTDFEMKNLTDKPVQEPGDAR